MPTLRQFEIFLEAAQDSNFRKTADRLGISQPAISSHIRLLELELGYAVFERLRGRSPRLTAEALALIPKVRQILSASRAIVPATNQGQTGRKLSLTLYTRPFLFEQELMPALSDFLSASDDLELDIKMSDKTSDITQALQAGACDIGLYRGLTLPAGAERVEYLETCTMSIYASTQLAQQFRATPGTIEDLPFVLPREDQEANSFLLHALKDVGLNPKQVVARSQFPKTLAQWVMSGRGVSPLLDRHMQEHVSAQTIEPIVRLPSSIKTIMALSQRALDNQAAPLLELIRNKLAR